MLGDSIGKVSTITRLSGGWEPVATEALHRTYCELDARFWSRNCVQRVLLAKAFAAILLVSIRTRLLCKVLLGLSAKRQQLLQISHQVIAPLLRTKGRSCVQVG